MADNAHAAGANLPVDASPAQQALNRRLLSSAQGKGGVYFGSKFRLIEAPYPDASSAACAHLQVNAAGGWKTVFVVKPDGTFEGVAP